MWFKIVANIKKLVSVKLDNYQDFHGSKITPEL
jgi:hypothetical protein